MLCFFFKFFIINDVSSLTVMTYLINRTQIMTFFFGKQQGHDLSCGHNTNRGVYPSFDHKVVTDLTRKGKNYELFSRQKTILIILESKDK